MKMTPKRILIIVLSFFAHFIGAQQQLYIETNLGGCYEPLPTAYYVELDSTIDVDEILLNDSLLVNFLNSAPKIYCSSDLIYLFKDIDSSTQENFQSEYIEKRKSYTFIREEKWDNFYVKIAVINHNVKYTELKWVNPKSAEEYEYNDDSIHIKIVEKSIFNYAYSLK